jgi:hypothetical protein
MCGPGLVAVPNPAADAEMVAMRVRLAVVEAEVKNLKSEMQAEGIDMTGINFVSLVGIEDSVARGQVSNSPTLLLDIRVGSPSGVPPQHRLMH